MLQNTDVVHLNGEHEVCSTHVGLKEFHLKVSGQVSFNEVEQGDDCRRTERGLKSSTVYTFTSLSRPCSGSDQHKCGILL